MRFSQYFTKSYIGSLFRLHKSLEVFFLQIGQGVEISSQDCMILLSLLFEKRSVKPSELLLTFDFSKSTISQAISRLEGRNLVARVSNDKDARRVAFRITRKGLEYANSLIENSRLTDQGLMRIAQHKMQDKVLVDRNCELFLCCWGVQPSDVIIEK